jgi:hypothetical protein
MERKTPICVVAVLAFVLCHVGLVQPHMFPKLRQRMLSPSELTADNETESKPPTSRIVFMAPKSDEHEYTLNKMTDYLYGNYVKKGWIVEANQPRTFLIYLLMTPDHISAQNPAITIIRKRLFRANSTESSTVTNSTNKTSSDSPPLVTEYQKHIYYIYFTLDAHSCADYLAYQHIPLILDEPVVVDDTDEANSTTRPVLIRAELTFSLKHSPIQPYYICMSRANRELIDSADPQSFLFYHQGQRSMFTFTTEFSEMPVWFKYSIYTVLVCFNSILNGLNIGLMALSVDELELLIKTSESAKERMYAKNILPLRKKGNYLLCSILLSITLTGSVSVLVLDDLLEGLLAGKLNF